MQFLRQSIASFRGLIQQTKAVGIPNLKHGAAFAAAVLKHERAAVSGARPLVAQAMAVDVSSAARFATTYTELSSRLGAYSNKLKKQARGDAALQHAPSSLHRVAAFLTTSAHTCPAQ